MKTYDLTPVEISIADYQIFGVSLGESGRGRKLTTIPCPKEFKYLEPGLTKTGKPRLNSSSSDKGWIARVSTSGAYIRGARGNVSVPTHLLGEFNVIAKGYGAFGDAGRTGTWDDLIFSTLLEEFILRVKPSRGDAYLLVFSNGKVTRLSFPEADALEIEYGDSSPSSRGTYFTKV
jgi:hypothetical protein